jgi:hypothetical protein
MRGRLGRRPKQCHHLPHGGYAPRRNLKKLEDFNGHYVFAAAGAGVGGGAGAAALKNQNEVEMALTATGQGVKLSSLGPR